MLKKILSMMLFATLVSACASTGSNQEGYETVNSQREAERKNADEPVAVDDRVYFKFDSSDLSKEARATLDDQIGWMMQNPTANIVVEGHCDERGTREYNLALGDRRANAVKKYMVSKGVNPSRIKTISYGKERPAFVGSGESIWSKNRRAVTLELQK